MGMMKNGLILGATAGLIVGGTAAMLSHSSRAKKRALRKNTAKAMRMVNDMITDVSCMMKK